MPGLSSASEFWVGSWRFRCRVKDHILQISIMQGQIKSMQVLIDSNQLCLTCPVDILTKTTVDWGMTSLMPEMKIPCVEAASSFHGITLPPSMENSPVLTHRGLLSRFCLMQQSVTLPSKTLCCLIVQRPDKGLVKSRTHRTHSRSHQEGEMWTPGGCPCQPRPDLEEVPQVFSCFHCTGREILIIKHSFNV